MHAATVLVAQEQLAAARYPASPAWMSHCAAELGSFAAEQMLARLLVEHYEPDWVALSKNWKAVPVAVLAAWHSPVTVDPRKEELWPANFAEAAPHEEILGPGSVVCLAGLVVYSAKLALSVLGRTSFASSVMLNAGSPPSFGGSLAGTVQSAIVFEDY